MRGEPYDPVLERYASFWNYMMTKDPVYVQLSYSDEEIRGYMENAGIKNGFFTVKMGDREATQFYSATKTTSPIQSKERYDARYKNLTSGGILLDEYEAGDIFKIGDKEYILSENHTLIFRMERIFIIWNIQVIISLGKRLSENNGQKRISKEDTDMSMTGISNSYNNYVTQNTILIVWKNIMKNYVKSFRK